MLSYNWFEDLIEKTEKKFLSELTDKEKFTYSEERKRHKHKTDLWTVDQIYHSGKMVLGDGPSIKTRLKTLYKVELNTYEIYKVRKPLKYLSRYPNLEISNDTKYAKINEAIRKKFSSNSFMLTLDYICRYVHNKHLKDHLYDLDLKIDDYTQQHNQNNKSKPEGPIIYDPMVNTIPTHLSNTKWQIYHTFEPHIIGRGKLIFGENKITELETRRCLYSPYSIAARVILTKYLEITAWHGEAIYTTFMLLLGDEREKPANFILGQYRTIYKGQIFSGNIALLKILEDECQNFKETAILTNLSPERIEKLIETKEKREPKEDIPTSEFDGNNLLSLIYKYTYLGDFLETSNVNNSQQLFRELNNDELKNVMSAARFLEDMQGEYLTFHQTFEAREMRLHSISISIITLWHVEIEFNIEKKKFYCEYPILINEHFIQFVLKDNKSGEKILMCFKVPSNPDKRQNAECFIGVTSGIAGDDNKDLVAYHTVLVKKNVLDRKKSIIQKYFDGVKDIPVAKFYKEGLGQFDYKIESLPRLLQNL